MRYPTRDSKVLLQAFKLEIYNCYQHLAFVHIVHENNIVVLHVPQQQSVEMSLLGCLVYAGVVLREDVFVLKTT